MRSAPDREAVIDLPTAIVFGMLGAAIALYVVVVVVTMVGDVIWMCRLRRSRMKSTR